MKVSILYPYKGKILTLTRDLKVEILARRFWKEYLEPTMPEFDISLFLPQLSKIKSVADKMKHINKYIIVRAYKDGRFQLRTKGSTIKTTVNFPKCDRPEWQNTEEKWVFSTRHQRTVKSRDRPVRSGPRFSWSGPRFSHFWRFLPKLDQDSKSWIFQYFLVQS